MGSIVKRPRLKLSSVRPTKSPLEPTYGGLTLSDLHDLVSTRVVDEGADPAVFTRRELEAEWSMSESKTLQLIQELYKLGKVEPVKARRQSLHGPISVKAYRLKP